MLKFLLIVEKQELFIINNRFGLCCEDYVLVKRVGFWFTDVNRGFEQLNDVI